MQYNRGIIKHFYVDTIFRLKMVLSLLSMYIKSGSVCTYFAAYILKKGFEQLLLYVFAL